jgi:hypothetical protein
MCQGTKNNPVFFSCMAVLEILWLFNDSISAYIVLNREKIWKDGHEH